MSKKKLNVGQSTIWRKEGWIGIDHKPSRVDQPTILGDANSIPLDDKIFRLKTKIINSYSKIIEEEYSD